VLAMTIKRFILNFLIVSLLLLCIPAPATAKTLIGVVLSGNTPYFSEMHKAFSEVLEDSLPSNGNTLFILQKPFPAKIALSNAARKLIILESDVIVALGSPAVQAVLEEKSESPLVYGGVYDPDTAQFIGPNITGCGYKVPLSSLLRYLRSIKQINKLDVIYSSQDIDSLRQVNELASMISDLQISLNKIDIKHRDDLEDVADRLRGDAVFITASSIADLFIHDILTVLKKRGLPSAFVLPDKDRTGVTVALFNEPGEQGRKIAEMVLRVLDGQNPVDIKPEIFRKTELTFNLKEAEEMNIKLPFNLVVEATELIR
jgi:putative ABC transport system substrate-binding protein